MPDKDGNEKADATETPLHAYKDGREEDVEEGSLGVATGGPDAQTSRLPEGADEKGSFQTGGFAGAADDAPNSESQAPPPRGVGDLSPEGTPDRPKLAEEGGDPLRDVGPGAKDPAPMERGTHGAEEVGERGLGSKTGGIDGG